MPTTRPLSRSLAAIAAFTFAPVLALSLSACALLAGPGSVTHDVGVDVHAAWARPAGEKSTTAVYFSLENHGVEDETLLGAEVAGASASIHQTVHEDDIARMREVTDGLSIGAGEAVSFEPLSYHVMVTDLPEALVEGEALMVTLNFEHAGEVSVRALIANSAPEDH